MASAYICDRGFKLSTLKTATELFTDINIKSNISNMYIFNTICYTMLICRTKEKSTARVREVVIHILDIFPNANQIIRCVKFR